MTEGIIEQTFKEHMKELCQSEYFDEVMVSNYLRLRDKLIEKIREWDKNNRGYYPYHISLKDLIGDNQE